jgi:hypothetical protein
MTVPPLEVGQSDLSDSAIAQEFAEKPTTQSRFPMADLISLLNKTDNGVQRQ